MKFDWKHGILEWGGIWYIAVYPNWLPRRQRHFGPYRFFYDQPHYAFGFWFFNFSWSTPWNSWKH